MWGLIQCTAVKMYCPFSLLSISMHYWVFFFYKLLSSCNVKDRWQSMSVLFWHGVLWGSTGICSCLLCQKQMKIPTCEFGEEPSYCILKSWAGIFNSLFHLVGKLAKLVSSSATTTFMHWQWTDMIAIGLKLFMAVSWNFFGIRDDWLSSTL